MELKDFVETSLQQICDGIKAAQDKIEGGAINPSGFNPVYSTETGAACNLVYDNQNRKITLESVEFDVAVTVTEGKETKGGIGVFAGAVSLGSQGKSDSANKSLSRLKFSVPIIFPSGS